MKKILSILFATIREFIKNSFWRSWYVLVILVISLALNGVLWYIYMIRIEENPIPFIFASGLIGLNLILANLIWEKEKLVSILLISVGLLVQILMLIFIRYLLIIVF